MATHGNARQHTGHRRTGGRAGGEDFWLRKGPASGGTTPRGHTQLLLARPPACTPARTKRILLPGWHHIPNLWFLYILSEYLFMHFIYAFAQNNIEAVHFPVWLCHKLAK